MPSPDETAGYQAALTYRWASGQRRRAGTFPTLDGDDRDQGAPDGASAEFLVGWRAGVDATAAW